ncbi:hypothetical protein FB565_005800 [Actinoplanes lutulentus]|uniref:Excreted virulence factor EspC (Type VII ESX diderm) n=1 Tax=Actinoplanes lutulentus TaxID=1287878 RepID=A0A327Z5Z7_9ACTN|nr:hypothetical protein [Actinoplanes lutulentus]MBB2946042.1 hypothetical protein [Actinoplanes lutulentus]RAK32732.1 hypothetical protein B0I29_11327 [Actinoplanes lutulentus]
MTVPLGDQGHIEADIRAMEKIAARLADSVERDYTPRAITVSDTLLTQLTGDATFTELDLFVHAHAQAQEVTLRNVCDYADGTWGLAAAARAAGALYAESDANAQAVLGGQAAPGRPAAPG